MVTIVFTNDTPTRESGIDCTTETQKDSMPSVKGTLNITKDVMTHKKIVKTIDKILPQKTIFKKKIQQHDKRVAKVLHTLLSKIPQNVADETKNKFQMVIQDLL